MPNITKAQQAWERICQAGEAGRFVPILGFELSSLREYQRVASARSAQKLGNESPQLDELGRQTERIALTTGHLRARDDERTANYLGAFDPKENRRPGSEPDLGTDPAYVGLIANLACLASELIQNWARALALCPAPLGPEFHEAPQPLDKQGLHAYSHMKRSLNCCAVLIERTEGREPNSLQLGWVYEKLLLLASEIFSPKMLWEGPDVCLDAERCCGMAPSHDFRERHLQLIRRFPSCNWTEDFQVISLREGGIGLRRSHLVWLQGLIRHLLLAGTRAFRTREELTFLLLLNNEIGRLPDVAADPFEMGLLYSLRGSEDTETLNEVLAHCDNRPRGADGRPSTQPFYRAMTHYLKSIRGDGAGRAGRQVVLSMCLDREMEKALSNEFDSFRVALPVDVPLLKYGAKSQDAAWWIGDCIVDPKNPAGYSVVRWTDIRIDPERADLAHPGPLVVKLFGSPLESLPRLDDARCTPGPNADPGGFAGHRLVLDETELLAALIRHLPETFADLGNFLLASELFFFGQNALRWSDRVPYFIMRSISPPDPVHKRAATPAVSFGESGIVGATALDKLSVWRVDAAHISPTQIIQRFMDEVAKR